MKRFGWIKDGVFYDGYRAAPPPDEAKVTGSEACPLCRGFGILRPYHDNWDGIPCWRCNGTGKREDDEVTGRTQQGSGEDK